MEDYNRQINIIVGSLRDVSAKTVKRLVLNIVANLKEDTPRDTSWARSNWIPTLFGPQEGAQPNPNTGVGETQTRFGVQEEAVAHIAANYKLENGAVYISNNVPYIVKLNEGHSLQAPSKFVESCVQRGIDQT